MIIPLPEVNMYASKVAFDTFMEQYNENKEYNREMLKSTHLQLFDKLIQLSQRQIKKERIALIKTEPECLQIDTDNEFTLYTNTTFLSKILKCSLNTVRNRIRKLEDAGAIISKTGHGRYKNYELHINPELLLINDVNTPSLISKSKYFSNTEKLSLESGKTQNLHQSINKQDNTLNNKVMNVSGVNNSKNGTTTAENLFNGIINHLKHLPTSDEQLQEHHKSNQKQAKAQKLSQQLKEKRKKLAEKKEKSPAELQAERLRTFKNRIARWLVAYAISVIWKNKNIVEAEYVRTVQYVEKNYLADANFTQSQQLETQFKWRIDAVGRYIERKKYNMTQFPYQYFHKTNTTSGFVKTEKWFEDAKYYYEQKMLKKTKKTDWQKLQDAINRYTKNKTLANFRKEEHYVKDNIPEYHGDFLKHFSQTQFN